MRTKLKVVKGLKVPKAVRRAHAQIHAGMLKASGKPGRERARVDRRKVGYTYLEHDLQHTQGARIGVRKHCRFCQEAVRRVGQVGALDQMEKKAQAIREAQDPKAWTPPPNPDQAQLRDAKHQLLLLRATQISVGVVELLDEFLRGLDQDDRALTLDLVSAQLSRGPWGNRAADKVIAAERARERNLAWDLAHALHVEPGERDADGLVLAGALGKQADCPRCQAELAAKEAEARRVEREKEQKEKELDREEELALEHLRSLKFGSTPLHVNPMGHFFCPICKEKQAVERRIAELEGEMDEEDAGTPWLRDRLAKARDMAQTDEALKDLGVMPNPKPGYGVVGDGQGIPMPEGGQAVHRAMTEQWMDEYASGRASGKPGLGAAMAGKAAPQPGSFGETAASALTIPQVLDAIDKRLETLAVATDHLEVGLGAVLRDEAVALPEDAQPKVYPAPHSVPGVMGLLLDVDLRVALGATRLKRLTARLVL